MSLKSSYLILYNLIQFIGNVCLIVSMIKYNVDHGLSKTGCTFRRWPIPGTYEMGSPILRILLLMQWLEILHSLFRLSKGSPFASLMQVGFKSVVFFTFLDSYHADEIVRGSKAAGALLLVWSLADAIRYPFYLMSLLHADYYAVKWLRHSAWIILYPVGISLEAVVVYHSIPHIRRTGRLRLDMPNQLNMAIDPVLLINLYLYVGIVLGSYSMLTYMASQRKKALAGPTDNKEKKN